MKNLNIRERIVKFIKTLPKDEVLAVKAYGSSIAYQEGYKDNEKKQVDLIVIVDNIKKFYRENLKLNRYMYSFTPRLYFRLSSREKMRKHAGICYTTDINYRVGEVEDTYKMGVIEKNDVLEDLREWKTFYIAGRFQKEVYTAVEDKEIEQANEINRRNALIVGLLLLDKEKPTLLDLYEKICSLSYMGDSRKNLKAEDPNKVRNIASGSKEYFDQIYGSSREFFELKKDIININYDSLFKGLKELPINLKEKIIHDLNGDRPSIENMDIVRKSICEYLENIIRKSSTGQTIKGIFTTGFVNSVGYALRKLKKGRKK